MKLFPLTTRLLLGGLFIGHGTQKLQGWFDGPGLEGTAGMMASLGLHPPKRNAVAAGLSEAVGGAMLAAGLATPLASAAITGTMITAIRTVHLTNGPWVTKGGYEYNAVLIAAALLVAEVGPGAASVDALLGIERSGPGWALGALALGAAASAATIEMGRRAAPPVAAAPPAAGSDDDAVDGVTAEG